MKPLFIYLSSCDTCKKMLAQLPKEQLELQDIKKNPVTAEQLDAFAALAGGYEPLFSRRSQLYKQRNLKDVVLVEADYRELILSHYTFIKRPLLFVDGQLFFGNSAEVLAQMQKALGQ